MSQTIYSQNKHVESLNHNKLRIECPLKYSVPENGIECVQEKCAWFMMIQKACAINVQARII
jgi:hypothetical protein